MAERIIQRIVMPPRRGWVGSIAASTVRRARPARTSKAKPAKSRSPPRPRSTDGHLVQRFFRGLLETIYPASAAHFASSSQRRRGSPALPPRFRTTSGVFCTKCPSPAGDRRIVIGGLRHARPCRTVWDCCFSRSEAHSSRLVLHQAEWMAGEVVMPRRSARRRLLHVQPRAAAPAQCQHSFSDPDVAEKLERIIVVDQGEEKCATIPPAPP